MHEISDPRPGRLGRIASASLLAALFALGGGWAAGCSKNIPTHDGYRTADAEGWNKPEVLELDSDREAEIDSELSYPKRRRARWFAVDLSRPGELEVMLSYAALSAIQADEEPEEDEDDPFDLAFEVYDASYRMLTRADNREDDVGERRKRRTLYELPAGRYLIHVYLQRRLDEVEYTLRVQHRLGEFVASASDFPKTVAFYPDLPAVPKTDDAPRPEPPRCRGRRCRGKPNRPSNRPKPRNNTPAPSGDGQVVAVPDGGMRARIIGIRAAGGGTRITINRGSAHGVAKGWRGQVVTAKSKSIANGSFTLDSVKAQESYATVRASSDTVSNAARAIIQP
ncbi:hypothetical protein [Haliangium ochraceum]|nr:hypothetical protein [Haliangium ochraceum]